MYLNPNYRIENLATQHDLIETIPMGMIVSAGKSGLDGDFVPFLLDRKGGEKGVLQTHLHRMTPQLEALAEVDEVMVLFQGTHAYVSPSWYVSAKENNKAVPTWDFSIVSVWGKPRLISEPDRLKAHLHAIVDAYEAFMPNPWSLSQAPDTYLAKMMTAIAGIEIEITRIEAKIKANQNKSDEDRKSVAEHLRKTYPDLAEHVWPSES